MANPSTIIIIAGMHRSGTSTLSRVINLMGAELCAEKHLVPPGESENTQGYWEDSRIVDLNERIFRTMNMRSDDVDLIEIGFEKLEIFNEIKKDIRSLLEAEYLVPGKIFLMKDPRFCRTLPVWSDVFEDLNCEIKVVIPFRHPLEAARSIVWRHNSLYDVNYGLMFWLLHNIEAERNTRPYLRTFLYYPNLLEDWQKTMQVATRRTRLELNFDWKVAARIEEYINPEIRRNYAGRHDLASIDATGWVGEVYKVLIRCGSSGKVNSPALEKIRKKVFTALGPLNLRTTWLRHGLKQANDQLINLGHEPASEVDLTPPREDL